MRTWQMQEAKARLSEVVKCAQTNGPQDLTLHGRSVAVVLSRESFERLTSGKQSLVDFMRASPLHESRGGGVVKFDRDKSKTRRMRL